MLSIIAVAWSQKKKVSETEEEYSYTIQASGSGKRDINKILKEMKDFKKMGEGYDSVKDRMIVLLQKTFKEREEWVSFANSLSFELSEIAVTVRVKLSPLSLSCVQVFFTPNCFQPESLGNVSKKVL